MPRKPPSLRPAGYKPYEQVRANERERGYTKHWAKVAAAWKREHPLCLGCQAIGRVTQTKVTDHIVPHKGALALFWREDNWQPACGPHHDVVKQRLELMYAQGHITAAALRLDSDEAMALTRSLMG